ncbi:hypothetical protein, partial [Treponema endosymbiont of Eucomonympha sp.]|uniref:hypothetical protein n=1 Tax=Treponema endosymbiont of Eucomonympha sp. TaxID=1580831 RepID=UPI000B0730D8
SIQSGMAMTETAAWRNELKGFIDALSDSQLFALQPLMQVLADDAWEIETDLTDEEREIMDAGRK